MKGRLTDKMMCVFLCAALGLASGFGLPLKAAVVEISKDMTEEGDWIVELDSGVTNVVTVAQTKSSR